MTTTYSVIVSLLPDHFPENTYKTLRNREIRLDLSI